MELRGILWLLVVLLIGAWIGSTWPGFNLIGRVTGGSDD